jgi:hypothetical protein
MPSGIHGVRVYDKYLKILVETEKLAHYKGAAKSRGMSLSKLIRTSLDKELLLEKNKKK